MKFGKTRTLRGQIQVVGGVAKKNIIVADGLVNYGLLIKSFTVWNEVLLGSAYRFHTSILSLDTIISGSDMNAGDNRQFAWNFQTLNPTLGVALPMQSIIDPDHIVNRDLFLSFTASSNGTYNYLIEAQVVELTDDEAIITIIKENSQS